MLLLGPVSSIFDFLTFYVMLRIFHAGEALFHTGWFIESMATQVLVIFIIRTQRNPLKSRPNKWLAITSLVIVAIALLLPLSPLASYLGFVAPPLLLYVLVAAMVLVYLFMAEAAKRFFYRYLA
jgi:Mg2+-importing ATPase